MKKIIIIASSAILLLAIALSVYLMNGCQKNVEPIIINPKISVSSSVINSSTYSGINGVAVSVDDLVVTTTHSDGQFTITNLEPGDYLVSLSLDGYSSVKFNLTVYESGASLPIFMLKELSPYVTIGPSGGSVKALRSTGEPAAELIIPAGELSGNKKVSATNLVGNEVPKILDSGDRLLGTTIKLTSDDANIQFENGAQLVFKLPFTHKPGDFVEVTYFNENTDEWDTFDNAIVNEDGMTATVIIHHFSTFSANINGSYDEEADSTTVNDEIIGDNENYDSTYDWTSNLKYLDEIPGGVDKEWLYKTVENQTRINFSEVSYTGTEKSAIIWPPYMRYYIYPPPYGYPHGQVICYWHLMVRCYWVYEYVNFRMWQWTSNSYVIYRIGNWYNICTYYWVGYCYYYQRIPFYHHPYYYYRKPYILPIETHQGGSGN